MKQLRREQQKTRGAGLRFAQCGAPLEAPPYLELKQRQQMEDFGQEPCIAWLREKLAGSQQPPLPGALPCTVAGQAAYFLPSRPGQRLPSPEACYVKARQAGRLYYVEEQEAPAKLGPGYRVLCVLLGKEVSLQSPSAPLQPAYSPL